MKAQIHARMMFPGLALAAAVGLAPGRAACAPSVTELDVCRQLGKACYENDDFKSAAAQFRRAVALAPHCATDYCNLGLVLMRAADYTNALAALREAERFDPLSLGPHYLRGIVYKRQGEFLKAIESLKRVLAGDPRCLGAYYNLAMCYKATEQDTNAIATLDADVELALLEKRFFRFECGCTHARMVDFLRPVFQKQGDELFAGDETIRIHCPRCGARHAITRESLEQ